jgi:hypothetical protein
MLEIVISLYNLKKANFINDSNEGQRIIQIRDGEVSEYRKAQT